MELSNRAKNTPESPIRKLFEYGRLAKEKGINIYHLNIGQPDLLPPDSAFEYLNSFEKSNIAYGNSHGEMDYLSAVVKYYHNLGHNDLTEDNIIATQGGSEAILWSIIASTNASEEMLVFEPFYTNYHGLATMAETKLIAVTTKIENGFHLPKKEEIEKKISSKTKAIILCNPNNPTGTVYTPQELTMIYKLCQEKDLFLLVDEVYREFSYDNHKVISMLTIEKENEDNLDNSRVIILDSLSKRYSLCGARIGSAVSRNKRIINTMLKFSQARLSAAPLTQQMGAEVISTGDQFIKKMIEEFSKRRKILIDELHKIKGIKFYEPEGAFYITAKLPIGNAEKFAKWLLTYFNHNNKTVMLAPAQGFYLTEGLGKEEVRIAYVLKEEDLKEAISLLNLAISKWNLINH